MSKYEVLVYSNDKEYGELSTTIGVFTSCENIYKALDTLHKSEDSWTLTEQDIQTVDHIVRTMADLFHTDTMCDEVLTWQIVGLVVKHLDKTCQRCEVYKV